MDDPTYHFRRSIELETEVRFMKEQLAQAQSGVQCLLNCLAQQQVSNRFNTTTAADHRVQQLEAECVRLHQQVRQLQSFQVGGRAEIGFNGSTNQKGLQFDGVRDSFTSTEYDSSDQCDLVSFDDDISPATTTTVSPDASFLTGSSAAVSSAQTPSTPLTPVRPDQCRFDLEPLSTPHGLGISCTEQPSSSVTITDSQDDDTGSATEADDGPSWQAIRAPTPPPQEADVISNVPVTIGEHNRLSGQACFIEDEPEEDLEHYWEEYAQRDGQRHTATEWRQYYEREVRPTYLAKMQASRNDRAAKVTNPEQKPEVSSEMVEKRDDEHAVEITEEDTQSREQKPEQGLMASRWAPTVGKPSLGEQGGVGTALKDFKQKDEGRPQEAKVDALNSCQPAIPYALVEAVGLTSEPASKLSATAETFEPAKVDLLSLKPSKSEMELESLPPVPHLADPSIRLISIPKPSAKKPEPLLRSHDLSPSPNAHTGPRLAPKAHFVPIEDRPLFFQFDSKDTVLCHTVLISNIPPGLTLASVLEKVRGGKLVSAKFLPTDGMKTTPPMDTNTVLLHFVFSWQAKAFVDFCKEHPLELSCPDKRVRATVQLIEKPTRPPHPDTLHNIHQRGLTRVLFIVDTEHQWSEEDVLRSIQKAHPGIKRPINSGRDQNGILYFQFCDVMDAGDAYDIIENQTWFFRGASKGFWPDPCERPLESLLEADEENGDEEADENEDQEDVDQEDVT
jgi:hypothetical protein